MPLFLAMAHVVMVSSKPAACSFNSWSLSVHWMFSSAAGVGAVDGVGFGFGGSGKAPVAQLVCEVSLHLLASAPAPQANAVCTSVALNALQYPRLLM
jgi:hypothetical protein